MGRGGTTRRRDLAGSKRGPVGKSVEPNQKKFDAHPVSRLIRPPWHRIFINQRERESCQTDSNSKPVLDSMPQFSRRRFLMTMGAASAAVALTMQPRMVRADGDGEDTSNGSGSGDVKYEWALFCVADPGDNPNISMDWEYNNPDLAEHCCGTWSKSLKKTWDPAGFGNDEPQAGVPLYGVPPAEPSYVKVDAIATGPVASEITPLNQVDIGVSATGTAYGNGIVLAVGSEYGEPGFWRQSSWLASSQANSQISVTCDHETGACSVNPSAFYQSTNEQHAPTDHDMSAELACIAFPFAAQAGCMGHSENHSDMFGSVDLPGTALYLTGSSNSMFSGAAFFTWSMVLRRRRKYQNGTFGAWQNVQDQSPILNLGGPQPPPPRGGSSGH
jgi:hypothetical protein